MPGCPAARSFGPAPCPAQLAVEQENRASFAAAVPDREDDYCRPLRRTAQRPACRDRPPDCATRCTWWAATARCWARSTRSTWPTNPPSSATGSRRRQPPGAGHAWPSGRCAALAVTEYGLTLLQAATTLVNAGSQAGLARRDSCPPARPGWAASPGMRYARDLSDGRDGCRPLSEGRAPGRQCLRASCRAIRRATGAGRPAGVDRHLAEHAADRVGEAGEVQAGGALRGAGAVHDRPAAGVEHVEVADQALQGADVAGGGDHGVRGDPGAVREHDLAVALERLRRRPRSRPCPCARRRSGRRPAPGSRPPSPGSTGRCRGAAARAPTGRARPPWPCSPADPVHEPDRQPADEDAGVLGGPAGGRAAHDVRDGAHGEPHPRGAALHQVDGDLGAGVADADDEDVLAGVRARRCGTRRRAAARRCTPRGRASPAGAGCGCSRWRPRPPRAGQLAVRRWRAAASRCRRVALDPGDLDAGDDLQLVVLGVLLQVAHHVVPGHPPPEPARHRQARAGPTAGGWCAGAAGRSGGARTPRPRRTSPARRPVCPGRAARTRRRVRRGRRR